MRKKYTFLRIWVETKQLANDKLRAYNRGKKRPDRKTMIRFTDDAFDNLNGKQ